MKKGSFFLPLLLLIFLYSCGGGDDGGPYGSTSITASDPYLIGAVFYYDKNRNGLQDFGEPVSSVTNSDGLAHFNELLPPGAEIRQSVQGNVLHEGLPYPKILRARVVDPQSVIITPLTTLLAFAYNSSPKELLTDLKTASTIYDVLEESDLYKDPMSYPNEILVQANLSAMSAIKEQNTSAISNYSGQLALDKNQFKLALKNYTKVFAKVLSDYTDNPNLATKRATIFFDYLFYDKGNVLDLLKRTNLDSAISKVDAALDDNPASNKIITLTGEGGVYSTTQREIKWPEQGKYFSINLDYAVNYQRSNEKIGNYPDPPKKVKIFFESFTNTSSGLDLSKFNEDKNDFSSRFLVGNTFTSSWVIKNKNGGGPNNIRSKSFPNGLGSWIYWPVFAIDFRQNETTIGFKSFATNGAPSGPSIWVTSTKGQETAIYHGIDFDPNNPQAQNKWVTNVSRTNNCFKEGKLYYWTADVTCSGKETVASGIQGGGYVKYKADAEPVAKDGGRILIKENNINKLAIEPPYKIIFTLVDAIPPATFNTNGKPTEFTMVLNDGVAGRFEPNSLKFENWNFKVGNREVAARTYPDLELDIQECDDDTFDCYSQIEYKVYAINKLKVTPKAGIDTYLDIRSRSGFFRDGFLYLDLSDVNKSLGKNFSSIIMNLFTGTAVAIGKPRPKGVYDQHPPPQPYTLNGKPVFDYYGISEIQIKSVVWKSR